MRLKIVLLILLIASLGLFYSCSPDNRFEGKWDFETMGSYGTMELEKNGSSFAGKMISYKDGNIPMKNIKIEGDTLYSNLDFKGNNLTLKGVFNGDKFTGYFLFDDNEIPFIAERVSNEVAPFVKPEVVYTIADIDLGDEEKNLDHAGLIDDFDDESFERGERVYNLNCINCHGTPEMDGSIPMSLKFWEQPFKAGNDPYSMYQTITKGYAAMPPQVSLAPQEKYDVIQYIREGLVRPTNKEQYFKVGNDYLAQLPTGTSRASDAKPYHPWSDMDYGNFFINTYELADTQTGPERFHSDGPTPYPDENYLENNFAYKGIAVRLDEGPGGISAGKAWMIFDHDLMRVAGGWTGEGFIDWQGILLNDQHETYPRTVGKLHFETPVGPAWADPITGSFEDTRFQARDGRRFGPLPNKWAHYKGIYHNGNNIVISYTVGNSAILEQFGMEKMEDQIVFTRTLNIGPSSTPLKMRVAPEGTKVAINGNGASLSRLDGFVLLEVPKGQSANIKLLITNSTVQGLDEFVKKSPDPESLVKYTRGGAPHYPQELTTMITKGVENGPIAVDELTPPFDNPWQSRMKLSGIDFMQDSNKAVACTTDGDIWAISGLTDATGRLTWKRIGSGLFQPLGIKVVEEKVYVICRDQLVRLQDLNGDGETDFYENFNSDHQVTDHFHEFAMGLQTDKEGNFYYAKSGRHAREALVPQHGTLLKVSKDGSRTDIIANGFRAANGVCINPDGSFIVTDQQGHWNPMNRINWVDEKDKFYGNMWGYNPPKDATRTAMEQPLVWIDMEFDRSPSELLWVDSKKWGPLDGSLLSFSYGYGKVQVVLSEKVNGQRQAGVVDLPGVKFLSGVMRGRFNPSDGNLYACGMSAWGTSQTMRGGGFYRLRYTGKPLSTPLKLSAEVDGVVMTFASELDADSLKDLKNFEVQTWGLVRSSNYGSERYNTKTMKISNVLLSDDRKTIKLVLPEIEPVDVMTIAYKVKDAQGNEFTGKVQNTIHNLKKVSTSSLKKVPLG
jgi:hypothetical protein